MNKLNTTPSRLAAAIGAALLTCGAGANAAVVLTADTTASISGVAITPTSSSSSPDYVNSYASGSAALGEAYGYSFARDSGAYAVSSNAAGIATATATTSFGQSITNDTGRDRRFSMSFHIYHGYMSTGLNGDATLVGTEFLQALYSANISVNGSNVFTSSATVRRDASGTSGSKSGVDLNAADSAADGDLSWTDSYYTIDLGMVANGGTIDVLALLADETSSNVGVYNFDNGGCCGFYGCATSEPASPSAKGQSTTTVTNVSECASFKGQAYAFYGDPIEFGTSPDASPFTISAVNDSNDVPEPGMFGLAFMALGAAGWAGRRRQQIQRD